MRAFVPKPEQPGKGHPSAHAGSKAPSHGSLAPAIVHDVLGSAGRPLDPAVRAFMDPRLGHDFSRIRVHANGQAADSARAVHAAAYTVGSHLVFGAGRYAPETPRGRRLLAHELAHAVQQRTDPTSEGLEIGGAADAGEREATAAAAGVAANQAVAVHAAWSRPAVQRQTEEEEDALPDVDLEPEEEVDGDGAEAEEDVSAEEEEESTPGTTAHDEGTGDGKKPKPLKRRRRPHRTSNFWGRGTRIFGGKRAKYVRHWRWTWGSAKTEREPSTVTTREQELAAQSTAQIPVTGDSKITAHGAAFYKGEPVAGTTEVESFEREISIGTGTPKPALSASEKSTLTSVNRTVTGTLQFRFGDESDPATGPRARIIVERQVALAWVPVYATGWLNTQNAWQTVTLDDLLSPDSTYRVRVEAEYWELGLTPGHQWADGRTQVDYLLQLQQQVTAAYEITRTKSGKTKVIKKAGGFSLRL